MYLKFQKLLNFQFHLFLKFPILLRLQISHNFIQKFPTLYQLGTKKKLKDFSMNFLKGKIVLISRERKIIRGSSFLLKILNVKVRLILVAESIEIRVQKFLTMYNLRIKKSKKI